MTPSALDDLIAWLTEETQTHIHSERKKALLEVQQRLALVLIKAAPTMSAKIRRLLDAAVSKRFGTYHLLRSGVERECADRYRQELQRLVNAALLAALPAPQEALDAPPRSQLRESHELDR